LIFGQKASWQLAVKPVYSAALQDTDNEDKVMLRNCSIRAHQATRAIAMALLIGAASSPALAVSVNEMVVWSAVNQPLRMDIELVDLQGANLRDLSVSVASESEHGRAGLTRPSWANNVSFKIIVLPSGKVIARAVSSEAVDAEFVSFMVLIRAAGVGQLQQVASKVRSNGAEPLASPDATPVAPRSQSVEPAPARAAEPVAPVFADKPFKPTVAPKPVVAPTPQPVAKPAAVAKPVAAPKPVVTPAPVVVEPVVASPSPAPAELVAAAEEDNAEVMADVGLEPTLESLQADRTQILQQITDLQTRVTELDQQIAALSPETLPESETAVALEESETSPAEPEDASKVKLLGYTYFSNVLLVFLGLFLTGMFITERIRARKG
jgi:hypothetical protein